MRRDSSGQPAAPASASERVHRKAGAGTPWRPRDPGGRGLQVHETARSGGATRPARPEEALGAATTRPEVGGHIDFRVAAQIATILDTAHALTRTLDRQALLDGIVRAVCEHTSATLAMIRVVEPDGKFVPVAWTGVDDEEARSLPVVDLELAWLSELFRQNVITLQAAPDDAGPRTLLGVHAADAAVLIAPLGRGEQPVGLLVAARPADRPWQPGDVAFVDTVASLAGVATIDAAAAADSMRWAAQLGAVQASIGRMNRLNTVESIGQAIVEETARVIDYHNCRVYLLHPPDDLVPIAFRGEVSTYREIPMDLLRTRVGAGFTGWVAAHGEPLLIHDTAADPRGATIPGTPAVDESMVVVPMRFEHSVIGVVTLSKLGLHQFDERDLRLMGILADAAATAIESSRALSEMQRRTDELASLLEMSSAVSQTLEPHAVADVIATHITRASGADSCVIGYWQRSADRLETWGVYPPDRREQYVVDRDLHRGAELRRALTSRRMVRVSLDDPDCSEAVKTLLNAHGHRAALLVPVVVKGRSIGLIKVLSAEPLQFDDAQLQLVLAMANEAGMALENARLYDATRALADHDPLTDFFNHRYLHERLGEEILRANRARRPVGLLMIDLDDFKLVNDTLGHQMGDRVLRWAADLIRSTLRESDVPARYGGDEFAVILPEADRPAAAFVARRLQAAFARAAFSTPDHRAIPIGLSIGGAAFPADARTPGDLIAAADRELYQAKRAGGHLHDVMGDWSGPAEGGHDPAAVSALDLLDPGEAAGAAARVDDGSLLDPADRPEAGMLLEPADRTDLGPLLDPADPADLGSRAADRLDPADWRDDSLETARPA